MSENILQKIINKKKIRIDELKKKQPLEEIKEHMPDSMDYVNLKDRIKENIKNNKLSIIAEIKKASPSAGVIIEKYDPVNIAKIYYNNKATCLSVLTEEDFFLGSLAHIYKIKSLCNPMDAESMHIPILCKDFFIDTYQVPLAKSFGADCILIILSAIDKNLAKDLYQAANDLNISSIIEVHSEKEAEEALSFEDSIIGINNRNLKTLEISLDTSVKLSQILNSHKNPLICESGIHSIENMKYVLQNSDIRNFLIGESLLKSENIAIRLREFTQFSL
jgi:indole-3-glycerol phosphate synthase